LELIGSEIWFLKIKKMCGSVVKSCEKWCGCWDFVGIVAILLLVVVDCYRFVTCLWFFGLFV
jgi:hypothetical protein